MIAVLKKDFLLLIGQGKRKKQVGNLLFLFFFVTIILAVETYLLVSMLKQVKGIKDAPEIVFTLFLGITFVLTTFFTLFNARRLFYSQEDLATVSLLPISKTEWLVSKIVVLFFSFYLVSLLLNYPLFIAYFVVEQSEFYFLLLGILYPLLAFLFEGGLALLFVNPLEILFRMIKKNALVRLILTVAIMFLLAVGYYYVLNAFITFLSNNEAVMMFSDESIAALDEILYRIIPFSFLADFTLFNSMDSLLLYLLISVGVFLLGFLIADIFGLSFANEKENKRTGTKKVHSESMALILKELNLLFGDDHLYSFTGLLFVLPFLLVLVIQAMNTIFNQGIFQYYISLVPSFVRILDILLVELFVVTVLSGASHFLGIEKEMITFFRLYPVSYQKQLRIKLAIPFVLLSLSSLISVVLLITLQIISLICGIFMLVNCLLLALIYELASLYSELNHNKWLPTLLMYGLPVLLFALSYLCSIYEVDFLFIGFITAALLLIGGVLLGYLLFSHLETSMEAYEE